MSEGYMKSLVLSPAWIRYIQRPQRSEAATGACWWFVQCDLSRLCHNNQTGSSVEPIAQFPAPPPSPPPSLGQQDAVHYVIGNEAPAAFTHLLTTQWRCVIWTHIGCVREPIKDGWSMPPKTGCSALIGRAQASCLEGWEFESQLSQTNDLSDWYMSLPNAWH